MSRRLEQTALALLALILTGGTLIRVVHLQSHRFHVDEALFAAYGMAIATGDDLLLQGEPVDKPPLFFYVLGAALRVFGHSEAAAAVPNLIASLGAVLLVYYLCRRFFDLPTALVAATLMAISPFNVAYAYTAFIDPTMVACALLAGVLAERRRFFLAGLCAGMLPALKAQGVLFLPIVGILAILGLLSVRTTRRKWLGAAVLFAAGAAIPLAGMWYWSSLRTGQRSFLDLAAEHNPLLVSDPATYGVRLLDWWKSSLQYMTGSPLANAVLLGLPLLLAWDIWLIARRGRGRRGAALDLAMVAFVIFFVGWHTYYVHPAWDRYMLGVVPFGLVLLARVLVLPWALLETARATLVARPATAWSLATGLVLFLAVSAPTPVVAGLRATYPIGWAGEGGPTSYIGIEDVAAYLRANAPPNSLLFDYQTLSWHYKYYLYGLPYEIVWFDDKLLWSFQNRVLTEPGGRSSYLVMPDWVNDSDTRASLAGEAVEFVEAYRAYRPDGTVSFTVYRLQPIHR